MTGDYTQLELAKIYNVGRTTVSDIINFKRWTN
jgi:DNA-binding XRE family transcriptional regulator